MMSALCNHGQGRVADTIPPCLFCGSPEFVEIHEIWGHEFMLQTCCESLHEQIVQDMDADPAWARELLRRLEIEPLTGHRLRRVADWTTAGSAFGFTPA